MIIHHRALLAAAAMAALTCGAAYAQTDSRPGISIDLDTKLRETPVSRALANLDAHAPKMTAAEAARAEGRMHLLAYMRRPGEGALTDAQALSRVAQNRRLPRLANDPDLKHAVAAYTAARDREPANIRTRSALAFALDRSGDVEGARRELRFAAKDLLRRRDEAAAKGAPLDAETFILMEEIATHLQEVGEKQDQAPVDNLRDVSVVSKIWITVTPILVPLVDGLAVEDHIDTASRVKFDFNGQGAAVKAGWLKPTAAWLVWDPSGREKITSGFQLFGSTTWVAHWDNGYRPLAVLDDNGDGKVEGAELVGLSLWTDINQNGRSDRGEVRTLGEAGVVSLAYEHRQVAPGVWEAPAGVTFADGETRSTFDWTFSAQIYTAAR